MIAFGLRHWLVALGAALAAHAALVGLFWTPADQGSQQAGMGGIEVSLGSAGGVPADAPEVAAEDSQAVPAADAASTPPPPDAAEPPPETPVTEAVPPEARPPEPNVAAEVPEPTDAVPPDPVEIQEARVVEQPLPEPVVTEAVPVEMPEIVEEIPPEEVPPETVVEIPPPEAVTATEVEPVVEAETRPEVTPPRAKPPIAMPQPEVAEPEVAEVTPGPPVADAAPSPPAEAPAPTTGEVARPTAGTMTGNDTAATAGGLPGAPADYLGTLQDWLERHKEYPRTAQRRRMEGTALLYFVVDRDGNVLEYRIERSTGHEPLDREVEDMLRRAEPLPAMPAGMTEARLELVVPIQFLLR